MEVPLKTGEEIVELPVNRLVRSYFQPRDLFDPEKMRVTRESIRAKGQKYPIVVRVITHENRLFDPSWDNVYYEIADGERRFRCCQELGFKTIRAVVRNLADEEMLDYTLTTNDSIPLNPIERSKVFYRLAKEFGKTQAEIAHSYNLKQQQISEYIRLLDLPGEVQELTARAVISLRHSRELLKLSDHASRLKLGREIAEENLSTRELTDRVKKHLERQNYHKKSEKISENDLDFDPEPPEPARTKEIQQIGVTEVEKAALISKKVSQNETRLPARRQRWGFEDFLNFFGQLNSLFLYGKIRTGLINHMRRNPAFHNMKPENYLTLIQICVVVPTIAIFALFKTLPMAVVGLAAFLASIAVFRLSEKIIKK